MSYSIYTRTGDKGKTRIGGGKAVEKNHARIHAFGEVDHINSWCGVPNAQGYHLSNLVKASLKSSLYIFSHFILYK